jgi:hypothetical protein
MLSSCEKDSTVSLTDGIWTFEDMRTDSEVSSHISLVSLAEALLTGSTLEFQEGGTYILSSPFAEDPTTGDWELIGNEQLVLKPDGEPVSTSNIETLTRAKLAYWESFVDSKMNSYTVTTTWIRD